MLAEKSSTSIDNSCYDTLAKLLPWTATSWTGNETYHLTYMVHNSPYGICDGRNIDFGENWIPWSNKVSVFNTMIRIQDWSIQFDTLGEAYLYILERIENGEKD